MEQHRQKVGSLPSVRRLPSYLHLLRQFHANGRELVSSTHLADSLHLDSIQVRKDLAITGIVGKPKIGYYVPQLIEAIEQFLGWNNSSDAFLVGAGNLGAALMGYEGFKRYGLNIVAAFDTDESKIGLQIAGRDILPLDKLPELAQRMHISIGIITVPASAAQEAADVMLSAGIKAIWNFAAGSIEVPEDVAVESVDLASSLAVLCRKAAAKGSSESGVGLIKKP